jgi:xanthine dehydrogenase accessory factor
MDATSALIEKLLAEGTSFVHVTVVRAQPPAPAGAGDHAVVLADGTTVGFVGGQCVESSVRAAAMRALADRAPLLLRVLPEGSTFPEVPGALVAVNPCMSGGALELFVEPCFPPALVVVAGDTPIAGAVAKLAEALGYEVRAASSFDDRPPFGAFAAVVASHGRDEPASIRAALDAGCAYVGLVASRRRGDAMLGAMDLSQSERARVHTPAGLAIGARTPAEIGLAIMAEVVQSLRSATGRADATATAAGAEAPERSGGEPATAEVGLAVDPVCGMTVAAGPGTEHRDVDGARVWFCGAGCADAYLASR